MFKLLVYRKSDDLTSLSKSQSSQKAKAANEKFSANYAINKSKAVSA